MKSTYSATTMLSSSTITKCRRTIYIIGILYIVILLDLMQDFDFATGQFSELANDILKTTTGEYDRYLIQMKASGFTNRNCTVATWDYFPKTNRTSPAARRRRQQHESPPSTSPFQCRSLLEDDLLYAPSRRQPTHSSCNGYNGILLIDKGDFGGASGTIFFLYMVGMLRWAEQHNFKPFVHYNSFSKVIYDERVHSNNNSSTTTFTMLDGMEINCARDARDPWGFHFPGRPSQRTGELWKQEFTLEGTGVWEHYFEPVSDFVPGDVSCAHKPLLRFHDLQILPGLHSLAPWMPHAWRLGSPPYLEQPSLKYQDWIRPQRFHAADIVQRYIVPSLELERRAACAHPSPEPQSLGIHIRHGDKRQSIRKILPVATFLPYCQAFVEAHPGRSIYLATDSAKVLDEIQTTWPSTVTKAIVVQPLVQGLSRNRTAAFDLTNINHHRTNLEALTDILALSKCTYLIHGWSAMTEAVIYLNPDVQEIDVEDVEWKNPLHDFQQMLKKER